jgi:hypothetical protein
MLAIKVCCKRPGRAGAGLAGYQHDLAAVCDCHLRFIGGIVAIVGAFQNRDIWLGLSGVVSVLFGIYAFRFPGEGALAVLFAIGIYAILVGVALIIGGFQVRKVGQDLAPHTTHTA